MATSSHVRDRLWLAVRLLVSGGLLAYIVVSVGLDTIIDTLLGVPLWVVVIALGLAMVNVGISAYKWQLVLRLRDIRIPLRYLYVYYYFGQFFNAFLPTTIGGDGARMYYLHRRHDVGADAASSVVIERATGLLSVFALAGIGGVVLIDHLPTVLVAAVVAGAVLGSLFSLWLLFDPRARRVFEATVFRVTAFDIGSRLRSVHEAIWEYRSSPFGLLPVIALSLVFRAIVVVNTYVVALGLGMEVPFGYFLVIVPLVELILLVPVSIQGFGVRETSYLYLFSAVGATGEVAVALGVVMQLVLGVFNNVVGGIVYALDGLVRRR